VALPPALRPIVEAPAGTVLLVDFDGSLSPIVADPAAAELLPATGVALARLVRVLGRVAVVSGRPAAFLAAAVPITGIDHVGLYGLERIVDGAVVVDERVEPFLAAVADAARDAEASFPGLRVERKGSRLVSVTVHWRTQPGRGPEVTAWAEAAAARFGLAAPLRGRMAVELRPPVPVDKGTVAVEMVGGAAAAVFAGDDTGDVVAFDALRGLAEAGRVDHAISIGVLSEESPPAVRAADVVVDGPDGLAELLATLADELSGRG
jgi:trehalose 6-phosphate phosphatase